MRLINCKTYAIEEFQDADRPQYANLSHTWGQGEVLPELMDKARHAKKQRGWKKVERTCKLALEQHYQYAWMFSLGWTLQELIAPDDVEFYDGNWCYFGDREDLLDPLSAVTNIDPDVLTHATDLSSISAAKKMSWAADRVTSRVEDKAYCLLSLFDCNLPMLHGEGEKSFRRLQEEILRSSNDHTIFAWGVNGFRQSNELLATSTADFAGSENVVPWGSPGLIDITTHNLRIDIPESSGRDAIEAPLALTLRKWAGQDRYTVACERDFGTRSNRSAAVTSIPSTTKAFQWPASQLINIAWRSQTLVPEVNFVFRLNGHMRIDKLPNSYLSAESWNSKKNILRLPKSRAFHKTIGSVHIHFMGRSHLGPALFVTDNFADAEYEVSQLHPPHLYQRLSGMLLSKYMDDCHPFQPCAHDRDCPFQVQQVSRYYRIHDETWRLTAAIRDSYVQGDPSFLVDVEITKYAEMGRYGATTSSARDGSERDRELDAVDTVGSRVATPQIPDDDISPSAMLRAWGGACELRRIIHEIVGRRDLLVVDQALLRGGERSRIIWDASIEQASRDVSPVGESRTSDGRPLYQEGSDDESALKFRHLALLSKNRESQQFVHL